MTCGITVAPMIPDGEEDALRPAEAGHEPAGEPRRRRLGHEYLHGERADDDPDEPGDHGLQAAESARLHGEDEECSDAGEERRGKERDLEQEVETKRRADELGDVGRHGDHLGLDPEGDVGALREPLTADLGEVPAGGDAEFRAHRLDEHRHQVRGDYDPQQQVAVSCAGGHVRGEVPWVDVGDRGDERRAQERPESANAAPLVGERLLGGDENTRLSRQDIVDGMFGSGSVVACRSLRRALLGELVGPAKHHDQNVLNAAG
jgi:hypothetical protein